MVKVAGHLQKSTQVMKMVNDTLKMPEIQRTMMEMSKGGLGCGGLQHVRNCGCRFGSCGHVKAVGVGWAVLCGAVQFCGGRGC